MSHGTLFDEDTQCHDAKMSYVRPNIIHSGITLSAMLFYSNKQRRRGVA